MYSGVVFGIFIVYYSLWTIDFVYLDENYSCIICASGDTYFNMLLLIDFSSLVIASCCSLVLVLIQHPLLGYCLSCVQLIKVKISSVQYRLFL